VGADARGKLEVRHGDVWNGGVQEVVSHGVDVIRLFASDTEDQRNVVGCKGPEDVLLPADLAQGEAAGIDVLEPADLPGLDHLLQAVDCGVVMQNVTDEEGFLVLRGQFDQMLSVGVRKREGLFHEDMLACLESLFANLVMEGCRSGNDDRIDLWIV